MDKNARFECIIRTIDSKCLLILALSMARLSRSVNYEWEAWISQYNRNQDRTDDTSDSYFEHRRKFTMTMGERYERIGSSSSDIIIPSLRIEGCYRIC